MVRMSEILILVRVRVDELDYVHLEAYTDAARSRLATVAGWHGLSVWRDTEDPQALLLCHEYTDVPAAERGLVALAGMPLLVEQGGAQLQPADVLRVRVLGRTGKRLSSCESPSYLSMSIRVADPGYGADLASEIDMIFQELAFLPGCLGSVYGENDVLTEEIVGLVTWASHEAFQSSLPPGLAPYEVRLMERIG